jgi:hypothetical protein
MKRVSTDTSVKMDQMLELSDKSFKATKVEDCIKNAIIIKTESHHRIEKFSNRIKGSLIRGNIYI